jgi:tripartite-type tricarboxylate transporter receptor subunit TctC
MRVCIWMILALLASAPAAPARAQAFPDKNVRIVVSLGAGSAIDSLGRLLAARLEKHWGRPVIVENRPGAGGLLAADYAAGRPHAAAHRALHRHTGKLLNTRMAIDPDRDLVPVARLANLRVVLATNVDVPARTMQEFVAHARSNPGRLNYAGTGRTSIIDTGIEVIARGFGVSMTGVTFAGAPQHITALLRNDVQLVWGGSAVLKEQLGTNRIRLLAAVSERRLADLRTCRRLWKPVFPASCRRFGMVC